ncbi:MAG: GTPase domain-containing protein [Candidatus Thorarchaeota archaeon]|nr:GTPase domain-containing protein [Candidatus Thorarchaeota archaeon]
MTQYKPCDYKAFITGPYQSGKTHLIHTLDPDAISIERPMLRPHRGHLGSTTAGFDLGRVVWLHKDNKDLILPRSEYAKSNGQYAGWTAKEVELRGVPGSLQYRLVRDAMRARSDLVLMVVDSSDPAMAADALKILEETREGSNGTHIEFIANKQDREDAASPREVASWLGVPDVMGLSATDYEQCKEALVGALRKLEKKKNSEPK